MVFSQPPISAGSIMASKRASIALSGSARLAAGAKARREAAPRRAERRELNNM